jgi:hypothetical protein
MNEHKVNGPNAAGVGNRRRREAWDAPRVVSTALKDAEKTFAVDEAGINDDPAPGPS